MLSFFTVMIKYRSTHRRHYHHYTPCSYRPSTIKL